MLYTSTDDKSHRVSFAEAVEHPVAPDGGLYIPDRMPVIPRAFFNNVPDMSLRDIAYIVSTSFIGDEIPANVIKNIVDESFAFDAPLVKVKEHTYALELFHGPTLTFKDYGARFMARVLHHLDHRTPDKKRLILVATLGNSGSATANGFAGLEGLDVIVMYPQHRLTNLQSAQLTWPERNIHAIEVAGTIDDCKAMLNEAIKSEQLVAVQPTGANSINVARIIPQISFAIYAYAQLLKAGEEKADKAIYSVPCGNLGNLAALMTATIIGMPASRILAVANANDALGKYLRNEPVAPKPVQTLTPSMDLTEPSNLKRIEWLLKQPGVAPVDTICVSDTETAEAIKELSAMNYIIDSHSAAAYAGLARCNSDGPKVFYATAHPAKNLDLMTRITGTPVELPVQLMRFMSKRGRAPLIAPTLPALIKQLKTLGITH